VFIEWIFLIVGFLLLVVSANFLIEGSVSLAKKFKISELIIGLTIVGFGTSAPELSVSIISAINKTGSITVGNVLGSNIMNIGLILGLAGIILPIKINKQLIKNDLPYLMIGVLLFILFLLNNKISRLEGILLLVWFGFILFKWIRNRHAPLEEIEVHHTFNLWKTFFFITGGIIGLWIGGKLTVDSATKIAFHFKISKTVIALTIIAIGTSLPEIITSIIAIMKRKADIGVGNIIGSDIFNLLLCLGVSSSVAPIYFNLKKELITIFALVYFTFILFPFFYYKKKLTRSLSIILLFSYTIYILYLILNRGEI